MTAERHDGKWGYYRCGRNAYRKDLCRARFCNADRAHRDLERVCRQVRLSREKAEGIRKAAARLIDKRVATAHRERAKLDDEENHLLEQEMRLTQSFTSGDTSPDVYKAQASVIRKRRVDVMERLGRTNVTREALVAKVDDALKLATSLWDLYEQLSEARQVELLRGVFATLVVSAEGLVGFTLKPPFDRLAKAIAAPGASSIRDGTLATAILEGA
jgi:hypothetical protein